MKLSHTIHKGIMESTVGSLFNKFKIGKRRDTVFFDDIVLDYFKEIKEHGYEEELRDVVKNWMIIYGSCFIPTSFRKMKQLFFFNKVFKKVWINLGYMKDINLTKENEKLIIETIEEEHVKKIGINALSIGGYQGFLSILFGKEVEYLNAEIKGKKCTYHYKLTNKKLTVKHKSKNEYLKLNRLPTLKGFTLKDALKMRIFNLKNNKVYFRNKRISPLENTFFHMVSNKGILLEEVDKISKKYFDEILDKKSKPEEKLRLLKTLLQVMGWGVIKIKLEKDEKITIKIQYPPHGLQLEKDNWKFLIKTIEGYLKTINEEIKLKKEKYANNTILLNYSL